MRQNFEVIEASRNDLPEISELVVQHYGLAHESSWNDFCANIHCPPDTERLSDGSFIVIDRIGAIRGFFIIRKRPHGCYRNLLDVPVVVVESGPNEGEIARTTFDYLLDHAKREGCDALRLGPSDPDDWAEVTTCTSADLLTGSIMPLA